MYDKFILIVDDEQELLTLIKIIFKIKNRINIIRVERRYFLKNRLAGFIILLLSLAIYTLAL